MFNPIKWFSQTREIIFSVSLFITLYSTHSFDFHLVFILLHLINIQLSQFVSHYKPNKIEIPHVIFIDFAVPHMLFVSKLTLRCFCK